MSKNSNQIFEGRELPWKKAAKKQHHKIPPKIHKTEILKQAFKNLILIHSQYLEWDISIIERPLEQNFLI